MRTAIWQACTQLSHLRTQFDDPARSQQAGCGIVVKLLLSTVDQLNLATIKFNVLFFTIVLEWFFHGLIKNVVILATT